jgi:hypothetical protein
MEEMMRESPAGFWANCALPASDSGATLPTLDSGAASWRESRPGGRKQQFD